jgi:hypothetical protein
MKCEHCGQIIGDGCDGKTCAQVERESPNMRCSHCGTTFPSVQRWREHKPKCLEIYCALPKERAAEGKETV